MRQLGKAIYIALCLLICAFPFVGMLAGDMGNQTAENRILASFPQWQTKGKWNPYFLQELGAYFEDHFALRTLLVAIDANIQSQVFGVSNVDTVTLGEDGWLYYTASLDDYQGKPALSRRGIANAVHNLSLVQQYVESKGASFLFAPVPNKATLYGTHMPYYIQKREGAASRKEKTNAEYEDEAIAEENYYEYAETCKDGGAIRTDKKEEKNRGEVRGDETAFSAVKEEESGVKTAESATYVGSNGKSDPINPIVQDGIFYERMKDEIDKILSKYPTEKPLEDMIEDSKWVRISYGEGGFYVFGVLYSDGKPRYVCYGVPATQSNNPPQSMEGLASFLPASPEDTENGYWVMYQDAETGASIRVNNV